ncbi:hypothetical protein [Scytonema millei]|uniref:Uncharacterized protein n=1 Tax=Scytonema millei VB511283 TaxID=1245923 RepID=A0A9X5E659_9CYAN|nr:hypothetical protein [Scytonema millei]NHC36080.1 hypothetical protein [Scytonema millei VB511283]
MTSDQLVILSPQLPIAPDRSLSSLVPLVRLPTPDSLSCKQYSQSYDY